MEDDFRTSCFDSVKVCGERYEILRRKAAAEQGATVVNDLTGPALYNAAQAILADFPTDEMFAIDPECEQRWVARLDTWVEASTNKVEAYRAVHAVATQRAEHFRSIAKAYTRLAAREDRTAERVERLAELLLRAADSGTGEAALSCSDGTTVQLRTRRSAKIEVIDEAAVPFAFIRTRRTVDRKAATYAIKEGQKIPGLRLAKSEKQYVAWGLPSKGSE